MTSPYLRVRKANILVDGTGTARVTDFGLMVMADLNTIALSNTMVSPGGTLGWMSPELLDPRRFGSDGCPTPESDCYALGMVIYEVGQFHSDDIGSSLTHPRFSLASDHFITYSPTQPCPL